MNLNIYNPYVRKDLELMHYGIKGMKWGKHIVPVDVLNTANHSPAERMAMRAQSIGNGSPVVRKPEMPRGPVISRSYRDLADRVSKKDEKNASKKDTEEKKKDSKDEKKSSSSSKKKKGSGKKSSGSKKTKTENETVEVEEPIIVNKKSHVNYSIDEKLGTRSIPSGGGNVRMTDMRGNAVNGPSGASAGSTSRPKSGRIKLTQEEADREYQSEVETIRQRRATKKALRDALKSDKTSENSKKGKEIADKLLKKSK